jgi:hypothetical protein
MDPLFHYFLYLWNVTVVLTAYPWVVGSNGTLFEFNDFTGFNLN